MPIFKNTLLASIIALSLSPSPKAWAEDRALLVGINQYPNLPADKQLKGALNDVEMMRNMAKGKLGYTESQIKTLTNEAATKEGIIAAINDWLIQNTQEGDRTFIYYSGHGANTDDQEPIDETDDHKDETLAPYDTYIDANDHYQGMLLDDELNVLLQQLEDKKVDTLFITDACHSGTSTRGIGRPIQNTGYAVRSLMDNSTFASSRNLRPEFSQEEKEGSLLRSTPHRTVWSASTDRQLSFEVHDASPSGVFTKLLYDGIMEGKVVNDGNSIITNKTLLDYLRRGSEHFCSNNEKCQEQKHLTPVLSIDDSRLLSSFAPDNAITPPNNLINDTFPDTENSGIEISIREGKALTLGQSVRIDVKNNSGKSGHLLLLDKRSNGELVQLFPNKFKQDNKIEAGKTLSIPQNPSWGFQIKTSEVGEGEYIAIISNDDADFTKLKGQSRDLEPVANSKLYLSSLSALLQELSLDGEFSHAKQYGVERLSYKVAK
jgi:hypothetical protein